MVPCLCKRETTIRLSKSAAFSHFISKRKERDTFRISKRKSLNSKKHGQSLWWIQVTCDPPKREGRSSLRSRQSLKDSTRLRHSITSSGKETVFLKADGDMVFSVLKMPTKAKTLYSIKNNIRRNFTNNKKRKPSITTDRRSWPWALLPLIR